MSELILAHQHLSGVTVITVGGELDLATASELDDFMCRTRRPGDHLVVDLADVTFIDCSGLRPLLRAHHRLRADGTKIYLAAPQPLPARVLKITGIDRWMPVHASQPEAVKAALAGPPAQ